MADFSGADIPDFSGFSEIRGMDLPEEAVVSRQMRDGIAELQESAGRNPIKGLLMFVVGVGVLCAKSIFELEKQIIELRKEVRRLSGG